MMNVQEWYEKLDSLKLSEAKLRSYHYPRPHPSIPGNAQIFNIETSLYRQIPGPSLRTCNKCFKRYQIQPDGMPLVKEMCYYHPFRLSKGFYPKYPCCKQGQNATHCRASPQHVNEDIDPDNLSGFITTINNSLEHSPNIFALDCEMVCTRIGMELAGICIVDYSCNVIYQTLVQPSNPVIDYLTDYSNLTETDFRNVATKLEDVHQYLMTLFDSKTILVGHALNNDLLWLKLIHDKIVDTADLYPSNKGPGSRSSLRYLKQNFLGLSGDPENKCLEDATASMKLALRKCD